jgi:putative tryptophan/tyrosine transport system substrate-binding protein
MDRRTFLGVTLGTLSAPLAVAAQQAGKHRVGFLHLGSGSAVADHTYAEIFRQSLRGLGYVEGQNVTIEYRSAHGSDERLPELAVNLVRREAEVIVASPNLAILAAKGATTRIPIVMAAAVDPINQGFITSFERPGGNITGVAWSHATEVEAEWADLLKEIAPKLSRVAGLVDRALPGTYRRAAADAAQRLGWVFFSVEIGAPAELNDAFRTMAQRGAEAVVVFWSPMMKRHRSEIVHMAARYRLPDLYAFREAVTAGGLMSSRLDASDHYARAATYVVKLLTGGRVSDLPVEQASTRIELVINLKTAKALGLMIPPSLLLRADQVIE